MLENIIINHRCHGSRSTRASVRLVEYKYPFSQSCPRGWYLYNHEHNSNYGAQYQNCLFRIKFCPFCGVELSGLGQ